MSAPTTVVAAVEQVSKKYAGNGAVPDPDDQRRLIHLARKHGGEDAMLLRTIQKTLRITDRDLTIWRSLTRSEFDDACAWEAAELMSRGSTVSRDRATRGRTWSKYPVDGFFGDYLEYSLGSEAPLDLNFWAAVTAMSAAVGRRYQIRRGIFKVFPNIPVVMIADSGAQKTTACRYATDLIKATGTINYMADAITAETLTTYMKFNCQTMLSAESTREEGDLEVHTHPIAELFLYAEELGILLSEKTYAKGLSTAMGKLFDCPPEHQKTIIGKDGKVNQITVVNPCLGFLGGVTPENFRSSIPEDAHKQGFMSRLMWIRRDETDRIMALPIAPSPLLRGRLVQHMRMLRSVDHEVVMGLSEDDGAIDWFVAWYAEHKPLHRTAEGEMKGYMSRKPVFLLRLACLFALAEYQQGPSISYMVQKYHLELALKILDAEQASIEKVTVGVTSSPRLQRDLERIRRLFARVTRESGCPKDKKTKQQYLFRGRIQREFGGRRTAKELSDILDTMRDAEELKLLPEVPDPLHPRPGRSRQRWTIGRRFPKEYILR